MVAVVEHVTGTGARMIACAVTGPQPLASFTVTVYVPGVNPVTALVVAPLLQMYVYGAVPPPTIATAVPVGFWHVTFVLLVPTVNWVGSAITTVHTVVQPLQSVTITVYVPAMSLIVAVVAPLLHR